MRGWRTVLAGATVAAALVGAGCGSDDINLGAPDTTAVDAGDLLGSWSGTVTVAAAEKPYYWTFESDGTYGLYDTCNWGGGTWSISDGHVAFGEMGSTTRACAGSDGVGPTEPPDFRVVDDGETLVVQTTIGEVRLPRVDRVPTVEP